MIKLSNILKIYNQGKTSELKAVNNVSLDLPDHGFVVILGKSGSGKTTLLNIAGGLDKASGTISYDDKTFSKYDMNKIDEFRNSSIGYIFQNFLLLSDETVYRNLDIALLIYGIKDASERKKRIDSSLLSVGMDKYRRKLASALSGGQKQRVAIARALAKLPKIVIADEPTGNLDSENSIEIMRILKDISKERLVLMVTHNENLAISFADRIIRFGDGCVINDSLNKATDKKIKNNNNVIYLEDFTKKIISKDGVKIEIFSKDDKEDIDVRLIRDGDRSFIYLNDKKAVLNDESILVKDKREIVKDNKEIESKFDYSSFTDTPRKQISFSSFLKQSFTSFFSKKRAKTKWFRTLCVLMGVAFTALTIASYISYMGSGYSEACKILNTENTVAISVNEKKQCLSSDEFITVLNDSNSGVEGLSFTALINYAALGINNVAGIVNSTSVNVNCPAINSKKPNIIYGKEPENPYEIALSSSFFDKAAPNYFSLGYDYESLMNRKISFTRTNGIVSYGAFDITPTLVGITDDATPSVYFDEVGGPSILLALNVGVVSQPSNDVINYVTFKSKDEVSGATYVATGSKSYSLPNIYVSKEYLSYFTSGLYDSSYSYNILGTVSGIDSKIAVFDDATDYQLAKKVFAVYAANAPMKYTGFNDLSLIGGKLPTKPKELLVPSSVDKDAVLSNLNGYTITGVYQSKSKNPDSIYTNISTFYVRIYDKVSAVGSENKNNVLSAYKNKYPVTLFSKDVNKTKEYFKTFNKQYTSSYMFDALDTPSALADMNIKVLTDKGSFATIIASAAVLVILLVIISLSTRSNMINRIYTISVYRSLGANKSFIRKIFLADSLINTTFTIVLGSLITYIIYAIVCAAAGIALTPFYLILIGILLAYIFALLGMAIPLGGLLKKTPYEISTKYDI